MTRTIRNLGAALLALAVLGATTAGAASAHAWLVAGTPITRAHAVTVTSTLTFIEKIPGFGFDEFGCHIHEEGVVKPGGAAEITKVTNTSGGKSISCTVYQPGEEHASSVSLEAERLPWKTTLATYGSSGVQELFEEAAKWLVTTQSASFGKLSTKCGVAPSAVLQNEKSPELGNWVDASFEKEKETSSCLNALWATTLYTGGINEIRLTEAPTLAVN
jgi:hypothetical protein